MTQQVVVQQTLLSLAQQGDPQAIATLINQVLWNKGITVMASRQGSCLQVLLISEQVPNQEACVYFIYDGMSRLGSKAIESIRVFGRQNDQSAPAWTQTFELKPGYLPPGITPPPPPSPKPKPKQKRIKTKYRRRVPLLWFGGVIWVLVATLGIAVRYQIENAGKSPSKNTIPQPQPSISLEKPKPKSKSKHLPKSEATPQPFITVPEKSDFLFNIFKSLTPANPQTPKPNPNPSETPKSKASSIPLSSAPSQTIAIKAVGDIVPGTNYPTNRLPSDKQELFQNVKHSLQGADILFGNFESTLTNQPNSAKDTSQNMVFAFRTPPEYAKLLKDTGFNVLNVANNHSMDFFPIGFEDTIRNIEKAGMKALGKKDQILYLNVKGIPIAFIGFSYLDVHNSVNDLKTAKSLVNRARKKAKIVVVSFHAGAEGTGALRVKNEQEAFYGENRGNLMIFSRTMIDSGADLVLGHSPHVPRAIELYHGKLIAYSLGNFLGYRSLSSWGELGQSLILEVKLNPEGDFLSGRIIPVILDKRGIPYIDKQARSVQLIRNLTQLDFPKTPITIDDQGQIVNQL